MDRLRASRSPFTNCLTLFLSSHPFFQQFLPSSHAFYTSLPERVDGVEKTRLDLFEVFIVCLWFVYEQEQDLFAPRDYLKEITL